jgi:hypothetical protein
MGHSQACFAAAGARVGGVLARRCSHSRPHCSKLHWLLLPRASCFLPQFWSLCCAVLACAVCRDIAPLGKDLAETNKFLDLVAEVALELQKGTNIRPLWGTAQLFKDPRYMHGAATSEQRKCSCYAHQCALACTLGVAACSYELVSTVTGPIRYSARLWQCSCVVSQAL